MPHNLPILLVDTNVWVDFFLPERSTSRASKEFIAWSLRHDVSLACPSSAYLDVYRKTGEWFKWWTRRERGVLTEADAVAIKRLAWDNVNQMQELATPIPVDLADLRLAAKYRDLHNDLEDDLVCAAALRAKANYLVTNDRALIKHAPITTLTPAHMLHALKSGNAQGTETGASNGYDRLYAWLSKEATGQLDA